MRRDMAPRDFRQEVGAEFVTFEGRVYESFDLDGRMVFWKRPRLERYHTFFGSIDFGFRNPCAMVVAGETSDGRLDVLEEHYETGLSIDAMFDAADRLHQKFGVRQWWGDAAEPRTISELGARGLPISPSPRTAGGQESFIQHEVRLVSGRLCQSPKIGLRFYGPGCPVSLEEHDSYRYPPVKGEESVTREVPLKKNDHTCNAVQYLCHGVDEWYGNDDWGDSAGDRDSLTVTD
jgi:hypothetical protein